MRSFRSLLPTALLCFALFNPRVSEGNHLKKLSLYEALIRYGLNEYAKFLYQYAPDVAKTKDLLVYAPSNNAVIDYLEANPQQSQPDSEFGLKWLDELLHKILPRGGASPNANSAANGNAAAAGRGGGSSFAAKPSKGTVSGGGTSGAKVSKPAARGGRRSRSLGLDYVGTITSGGGVISFVLQDSVAYDNGWFFGLDRYAS